MPVSTDAVAKAREALDRHTREIIDWHFDPATGCPFWLDFAKRLDWDPRGEVRQVRGDHLLGWHFRLVSRPVWGLRDHGATGAAAAGVTGLFRGAKVVSKSKSRSIDFANLTGN